MVDVVSAAMYFPQFISNASHILHCISTCPGKILQLDDRRRLGLGGAEHKVHVHMKGNAPHRMWVPILQPDEFPCLTHLCGCIVFREGVRGVARSIKNTLGFKRLQASTYL